MDIKNTAFIDAVGKLNIDSPVKKSTSTEGIDFKDILADAMDEVNTAQLNSEKMDEMLAIGEVENLHEVTIAAQKAELTLSLAVEVKNRLVEAYQEIMRVNL